MTAAIVRTATVVVVIAYDVGIITEAICKKRLDRCITIFDKSQRLLGFFRNNTVNK